MESENFYIPERRVEKSSAEISLDDCELSIRAYQFLKGLDINNLEELSNFTEEELVSKSPVINKRALQEYKDVLAKHGLEFKS